MKKRSDKKNAPSIAGPLIFGSARAPSFPAADENTLLQQAMAWHQQGRFQDAEPIYAAVIGRNGNNVIARNFFGLLKYQTGDVPAALDHLAQALRIDPGFAPAWNNHGLAL